MSLVVAIKHNDHVYFGADTQTTAGKYKIYSNLEEDYKIFSTTTNVVVGLTGSVHAIQHVTFHPEWFDELKDQPLTKSHIVEVILPKLYENLKQYDQLKTDEDGVKKLGLSMLIAKQDRLYRVYETGAVVIVPVFSAIGSGQNYALSYYRTCREEPIHDMMKNGLIFASKHVKSVGGDLTFLDTKTVKIERKQAK